MNQSQGQFNLYTYDEFAKYTKVVNLNEIGEWVWLKIPEDISRSCDLIQIDEIIPVIKEIEYIGFVFRQCRYPWLGVNPYILNKAPGYHVYKFYFADICSNDINHIYLSYQLQDDNPEKPYLYMKHNVAEV